MRRLDYILVGRAYDWSVYGRLIDWFIVWWIDWLIYWIVDWLIDWLIDWLTDGLIDWLRWVCRKRPRLYPCWGGFKQPGKQPLAASKSFFKIRNYKKYLFCYLLLLFCYGLLVRKQRKRGNLSLPTSPRLPCATFIAENAELLGKSMISGYFAT